MKEDWWKYALLALAAIAWYFAKTDMADMKASNIAQWQYVTREVAGLKERMSHLEGFHEAEKLYNYKEKR